MSKIKILSEQLTNKIAAGEVVQRPASIVKELVENSLDAGADEVTVVLKNGGKTLAEVVDNGEGMDRDDLLLAFERYATSKIGTVEDLIKVKTLGFRGEALASIAAVSRLEAISTSKGADIAYRLRIEGGQFRTIQPDSPQTGTTITVKNLFYNVPARRKFLKSSNVEYRHIVEIMRKFAMINHRVQFTLIHNGREVFRVRPESLRERIMHLFSPEYGDSLLAVEHTNEQLSIGGYIGNLNLVRARRGEQYLYVNRRFVSDRLMNHAVMKAYSELLSRGEFPFYCLHLKLPADSVDVNVHPSKMEVKFRDQNQVYNAIQRAVREGLKEITRVIPDLTKFAPERYYRSQKAPSYVDRESDEQKSTAAKGEKKDSRAGAVPADDRKQAEIPLRSSTATPEQRWTERARRFVEGRIRPPDEDYRPSTTIYQVHRKYIVSEIKSGLVIIDQHVAHERVLFDGALQAMQIENWKAQQLLFPQVVELSVTDFSILLEILPYLEKLGFSIKEFGENTIAVEAVPAGMSWGNEATIIKEIIDHYTEFGTKDTTIQTKVAASYACKAAIKSGDALSEEEMRDLVDRLFATENPYYCPHGRPIIINLTLKELDKRFERSS